MNKRTASCVMVTMMLGALVSAGVAQGQAATGAFQEQLTESLPIDNTGTCLGPGASGTLTRNATVAGRFTSNGPPAFGFHDHGSVADDIFVQYVDGRYATATLVEHFDFNVAGPSGRATKTVVLKGSGTVYGTDGQPLTPITISEIAHTTWTETGGDDDADPGEAVAVALDHFSLTCR
jgi:hypothetical protein